MSHLHLFEQAIEADWPAAGWRDLTVLVAVSGGADSVALLNGLAHLRGSNLGEGGKGRLVVAHFNHGWRGAESDGDARFVRRLAKQLSLPVIVGRSRTSGRDGTRLQPLANEQVARSVRYRFLADVAARVGARYIATGHTADDQVETILQRVLRGTGLTGLAGIPRVRRLATATTLIRPMLNVARADVTAYLQSLGQAFRDDSSNASPDFARNRIRRELLPLARELYPGVDRAIERLGALAAEAQGVMQRQIQTLLDQALVERSQSHVLFRTGPFESVEPYLIREALRLAWRQQHWPCQGMGLKEWAALAEMASPRLGGAETRARTFPGNIGAKKQGELLSLTRPAR